MFRISFILFLALPLLAQDAVNPCAVDTINFDCSSGDPAVIELKSIRLDGSKRGNQNVSTDQELPISVRLKYKDRAKGTLTTTFVGGCPDREEEKKHKPPVDVSWTATLMGPISGTQNFSGTGLEFTINAPSVAEIATLQVVFTATGAPQGCVTLPGAPVTKTFTLDVADGPYLTGISAVDAAGHHKTAVASGTYLLKASGEALDMQANYAGTVPGDGFDPSSISWSIVPQNAGAFIDGNTGPNVTWQLDNNYVSAAEDDIVITALIPDGTPTKYFLTAVDVTGPAIDADPGDAVAEAMALTPAASVLNGTRLAAFVTALNSQPLTARSASGVNSSPATILAGSVATGVASAASYSVNGAGEVELAFTAGSTPGSYWLTHERTWQGSTVLLMARQINIATSPLALSGSISGTTSSKRNAKSGSITIINGETANLSLAITGGLPSGKTVLWEVTAAPAGSILASPIPTGASSLTTDILMEGQPLGNYTVTASVDGNAIDSIDLDVQGIDLRTNIHNHPKDGNGLPTVSDVTDIDGTDDADEETIGGYLWVNDDNDNHFANDDEIDLEDNAVFADDDLEPLTYSVPSEVWTNGWKVRIRVEEDDGEVRLWSKNKEDEIGSGNHTSLNDFDSDGDGVIYVEGLKPGTVTVIFKYRDASKDWHEDRIKLTIFGIEKVTWESNGSTLVSNTPGNYNSDGPRLFPDKRHSNDTATHNEPKLKVTFKPALANGWEVPVVVRVIDIDHYSHNVLHGSRLDKVNSTRDYGTAGWTSPWDNGKEPYDNRTGYDNDPALNPDFGIDNDSYHIGIKWLTGLDLITHHHDTNQVYGSMLGSGNDAQATLKLVHHTPGNNWRAAASIAGFGQWGADRAIRVNESGNDGTELEYINDDTLEHDGDDTAARQSQTLTVWRKVYLEQDIMGPVNLLNAQPNTAPPHTIYPDVSAVVQNIVSGANSKNIQVTMTASTNRFQDGFVLAYDASHVFKGKSWIASNTNNSTAGNNITITLNTKVHADATYVVICDDDVDTVTMNAGSITAVTPNISPQSPNPGIYNWPGHFPAACIEVDPNLHDGTGGTPWNGQTTFYVHSTNWQNSLASAKGITSATDFWVVTHVAAYQDIQNRSADPLPANVIKGRSQPYWGNYTHHGAYFTYYESMQDVINYLLEHPQPVDPNNPFTPPPPTLSLMVVKTSSHELGHCLGGRHEDGGLMTGGDKAAINDTNFSGKSLRRFMLMRDVGP